MANFVLSTFVTEFVDHIKQTKKVKTMSAMLQPDDIMGLF
jgi:hypothetical protein